MEEKQRGKGHRIVLMPPPFQGHITPLLQLADILYSKGGFSITVVHTVFKSPNTSSYPHFTFHALPVILSKTEASTVHSVEHINTKCERPLREYLAALLSQGDKEDPVACFIPDATLYFTKAVCDEFRLPRLVLRTGGATSFLAFASFPLLRQRGYLPIQESRLEEPVVDLL